MSAAVAGWRKFVGPCVGFLLLAGALDLGVMYALGLAVVVVFGDHLNAIFGLVVGDLAVLLVASAFVGGLLRGPLHAGLASAGTRVIWQGACSFGDFFRGFKAYRSVALASLAAELATLACLLPGVVAFMAARSVERPRPGFASALGPFSVALPFLLVGLIPAVYLRIRWSFAGLLALERGLGATEALGASWVLTRGRALSLLVFYVQLTLVTALGLAACGVGVLLTLPLAALAYSAAYLGLAGREATEAPRGAEAY
jgi:hypothetical protein